MPAFPRLSGELERSEKHEWRVMGMNVECERGVMGRKRRERGKLPPPPRVGGSPLYKPYRFVPTLRVWFLRRFGLKTGIYFAHFVWNRLWSSKELRECMNVFYRLNSKWVRKREKYANSKWILRNTVCCCYYLSNHDIISYRSEHGCEKLLFWSKIGSGSGEPGDRPPPRIPRSTPRECCSLSHYIPRPCFH